MLLRSVVFLIASVVHYIYVLEFKKLDSPLQQAFFRKLEVKSDIGGRNNTLA